MSSKISVVSPTTGELTTRLACASVPPAMPTSEASGDSSKWSSVLSTNVAMRGKRLAGKQ